MFGINHFSKHKKVENVASDLVCSTSAYADGDVVGSQLKFNGVVDGERVGSVIRTAQIFNRSSDAKLYELYLFDDELSSDSTVTDNSALAVAAADRNKLIGVIPFDSDSVKSYGVNQVSGLDLVIHPGARDIYGVLVSKETPSLEANDLRISLLVEYD